MSSEERYARWESQPHHTGPRVERPDGTDYPVTYSGRPGDPPAQPVIVNVAAPARAPLPPNRVLHALLTIATGGTWGLVWVWREHRYRRAVRRG